MELMMMEPLLMVMFKCQPNAHQFGNSGDKICWILEKLVLTFVFLVVRDGKELGIKFMSI